MEHTLTNLKNFTEDRTDRGPGLHLEAQHLKNQRVLYCFSGITLINSQARFLRQFYRLLMVRMSTEAHFSHFSITAQSV